MLRARRRKERWSEADARLYRRHRWRSEGFHGEAKSWHGLARAVRRGLQNMRIQTFLTAASVNLKRLAAALLALSGGSAVAPLSRLATVLAQVVDWTAPTRAVGLQWRFPAAPPAPA